MLLPVRRASSGTGSVPSYLTGSTVPSAGLGSDGDIYFRNGTGTLYRKASGAWGVVTQWNVNAVLLQAQRPSRTISFGSIPGDLSSPTITSNAVTDTYVFNSAGDPGGGLFVDTSSGDPATVGAAFAAAAGAATNNITVFDNFDGTVTVYTNSYGASADLVLSGFDAFSPGSDGSSSGTNAVASAEVKAAEAGKRHLLLGATFVNGAENSWANPVEVVYESGGTEVDLVTTSAPLGAGEVVSLFSMGVNAVAVPFVTGLTNFRLLAKCPAGEVGGSSITINVSGITIP